MSSKIIEVSNLEHAYGKNKVLHGINFSVERGKIFGLLGKNGAGKTTTINIMMGFLRPLSGKCLVLGEESHNLSNKAKTKIALLHEGHLAYNFMNIGQTEEFYKSFYPDWDSKMFNMLMTKLGLKRSHKVGNMSCGQRSQVVLATLMAQNADVLLLDDFSMGLDAGYRRLFLDHLNMYVKEYNKTILVTTHIIQDLERFVDDAVIINKGNVLRSAPLNELKQGFYGYRIATDKNLSSLEGEEIIKDISDTSKGYEIVSTLAPQEFNSWIEAKSGKQNIENYELSLEDAFIALTGKY